MKERTKVAVFLGGFLLSSFISLCGNGVVAEVEDLFEEIWLHVKPTKVDFNDRMSMNRLVRAVHEEGARWRSRCPWPIKITIEYNADICGCDAGVGTVPKLMKVLIDGLRRYGEFRLSVVSKQRHCEFDMEVSWGDDGVVTFRITPCFSASSFHCSEESVIRYEAAGLKISNDNSLSKKDTLENFKKLNAAVRRWIMFFRSSWRIREDCYKVALVFNGFENSCLLESFKLFLSGIDNVFEIGWIGGFLDRKESEEIKFMQKVLKYFPKSIESLDFSACAIDDVFLSKIKSLQLKKLVIFSCKSVTDKGLNRLVKNYPDLEDLTLKLHYAEIRKIRFDLMKKLKRIDLRVKKGGENGNIGQIREGLRRLRGLLKRQGVEEIEFPRWA